MVRGSLAVGLIALAALAGTTYVESANAKPGYSIHPAESWKSFQVRAKNGYLVVVTLERSTLSLEAWGQGSSVKYSTPVSIHNGRFRANFGQLGSLSMRYVPLREFVDTTEPQGDCRGRRAEIQPGIFEGRFWWRG